MKKIYSTLLFALMSLTAFAQAQSDTTYVMLDFNLNPWNYPVDDGCPYLSQELQHR